MLAPLCKFYALLNFQHCLMAAQPSQDTDLVFSSAQTVPRDPTYFSTRLVGGLVGKRDHPTYKCGVAVASPPKLLQHMRNTLTTVGLHRLALSCYLGL